MTQISKTGPFLVLLSAGSGCESAIDLQTCAGNEGRFRTGEIGNHAGDLVTLSLALEGDQAFHVRCEGAVRRIHVCVHRTWLHVVNGNAARSAGHECDLAGKFL
jgi:hypothetical protein